MFKRKASTEEQAAAAQEEQVEIAIVNTWGGFTSSSEEHQANRARMVLQATGFEVYDRLKKGSIPSKRKDFTYVVAVYQKNVAEKILSRKLTNQDEDVTRAEAIITEESTLGGIRAHTVEGSFETIQLQAWTVEEEKAADPPVHEYTVVILENSIEAVKQLEVCRGWDWEPKSNSELDVEAEIYDPRNITTLQKQGALDVLGMVTAQSVASLMLPAAKDIQMPENWPDLAPTPEADNEHGAWTVIYKDCSVITKCTTLMEGEEEKRIDVPYGARVVLRLKYNGDQEPTSAEWPLLPLWAQCPEQIALMPSQSGPGDWAAAKAVDQATEDTFQYPKNGPIYKEMETPEEMFWVNLRWKTPGISRGRPALLDFRVEDLQEGEYYALAGLETASRLNGGRAVQHLDRRTGRASRPASHKSKKKKGGATSSAGEKPLGHTGKERQGSVPEKYHSLTRTVQESWKGAIDARATKLAQEKGEQVSQEKTPPCWIVATKSLEEGSTLDSLLIQLSKEGELIARGREDIGLLPIEMIDQRCKSACCVKEPCISAEQQTKHKNYAQMRKEMIDPGATQLASSQGTQPPSQQRTSHPPPQSPFGSMAGCKRGGPGEEAETPTETPTAQAAQPKKKPSPFRQASGGGETVEGSSLPRATTVRPQSVYANPNMFQFAHMGNPQMMMAPGYGQYTGYPQMMPQMAPQMRGTPQQMNTINESSFGGMDWEIDDAVHGASASAEALPAQAPSEGMTNELIADWKANVPALQRVTPEYKKVASPSAKTPWADLLANDGDQTTRELIAMKGAFDQELGGLQWNKVMWIQDIGEALVRNGVISDMHRMQQLILGCVEMGTVKSHSPSKAQLSFTKELSSRLQLPKQTQAQTGAAPPPAHHFLTRSGKGRGAPKGKGAAPKGKGAAAKGKGWK